MPRGGEHTLPPAPPPVGITSGPLPYRTHDTPRCLPQGTGETAQGQRVVSRLHLPWDQRSNDNMAEVAGTQPQGWGIQTLLGGCCFKPGVGREVSRLVCAH